MKLEQATLGKIFLIIFACIFIQVIYKGIITPATEGDSVDYHIPIAKSYLNGNIFLPDNIDAVKHTRYYPANSEALLSVLILTNVPLGLFNTFAIVTLFVICVRLGIVFKLSVHTSIIFAVTVCTLNVILRWSDTQIADIWLLNFFLLVLLLLEKPKKTTLYFLKLGIAAGLLVGTKFSGPFIALIIFSFYIRKIWFYINLDRLIVFAIPLVTLGIFWYFRNTVLTGNPLYPQSFLFFKGGESAILNNTVIKVVSGSLDGLVATMNSFISEFLAWVLIIPFTIIRYYRQKSRNKLGLPIRLVFLSFALFLFFINLPSANQTHIMTSSFRYFLSAMVPLILFVFTYFEKIGKIEILAVVSMASLLLVEFPIGYFPKLFLVTIPTCIFIYIYGYDYLTKYFAKRLD